MYRTGKLVSVALVFSFAMAYAATAFDVEFADPVNKKYPVDTAEHVRAAWSYIHHKDNAAKYDRDEVEQIEARIKRAAKKQGVEISGD